MNVIIKVPDSVVQFCKNKLKLSDKKISALYKQYAEFTLNLTSHESLDGFSCWFDENGSEALEEL